MKLLPLKPGNVMLSVDESKRSSSVEIDDVVSPVSDHVEDLIVEANDVVPLEEKV